MTEEDKDSQFTETKENLIDKIISFQSQLESSEKSLTYRHQTLKDFVAIASHDLRAPIRHISSYTKIIDEELRETLTNKENRGEIFQALKFILSSTNKMNQIIESLTKYSHILESSAKLKSFNIKACIENLITKNKDVPSVATAEITITGETHINADQNLFSKALEELLLNSCKFKSKNSNASINIHTVKQEDSWLLSIIDHGIGIDSKYHKEVFKVFRQLHHTSEYPGQGIGLSLVQEIAHIHNGSVSIKSSPNKGTTIMLKIPSD